MANDLARCKGSQRAGDLIKQAVDQVLGVIPPLKRRSLSSRAIRREMLIEHANNPGSSSIKWPAAGASLPFRSASRSARRCITPFRLAFP
jgi:hypothetical protein